MSELASEEIGRAQDYEGQGQRKKAVQHYIYALQHYQRQLNDLATDDYAACVIVEQVKLIMSHVNKLRTDIEKRPRNDDVDYVDEGDEGVHLPHQTKQSKQSKQNHEPTHVASSTRRPTRAKERAPSEQKEQREEVLGNEDEIQLKERILALCLRPDQMQNISWDDDVVGMESVKRVIQLAVKVPQQLGHIYKGNRVAATALLMYGPPGVGKTFIVKALACSCQHTFLPVSCASIISKYVGDSPKYVKAMLEVAKANKPCILFIDEIDALCPDRGGDSTSSSDARTIAEFLQQLDGITQDDMKGVVMIGATNQPWVIDDAMRRRFARMLYIPLPCEEDRYRLIARRLELNSDDAAHSITDQEMRRLAADTVNYSSADLVKLIVTAYESTIEALTLATHFRATWEQKTGQKVLVPCHPNDQGAYALSYNCIGENDRTLLRPNAVTYESLVSAMYSIKPSVDLEKLARYQAFTRDYGEGA